MLTGDINLMNVTDPQVPFARVKDTLRQADVLFGNLESCFYEPATGHPVETLGDRRLDRSGGTSDPRHVVHRRSVLRYRSHLLRPTHPEVEASDVCPNCAQLGLTQAHSSALQRTMTRPVCDCMASTCAHLRDLRHRAENPGVGDSIPSLPTSFLFSSHALLAH